MKRIDIRNRFIFLSLYVRAFWQYRSLYFPTISLTFGKGKIDIEILALCFGAGISFGFTQLFNNKD